MTILASNYQAARAQSNYHFDTAIKDRRQDVLRYLGHIDLTPAWHETVDLIVEQARLDHVITHMSWDIPAVFQPMIDQFGLADCMARLHVQKPGEMWNVHIDKLSKWAPNNPDSVIRIMIQLTDWKQGQFWEFGNYHWRCWRAGDVVSFDWPNIPHATANAGYDPRVTLQLTGVKTAQTYDFLAELKL